jgi:hypothetical protein
MEPVMFMPAELIVMASLGLMLLLVVGGWSLAVPEMEGRPPP